MEHIVLGKFELAIYNDSLKLYKGGSFRAQAILNGNPGKIIEGKIIDIMDRFDHCTLVSEDSFNCDFIKKESDRHIIVSGVATEEVVGKIIMKEVNKLLEENIPAIKCEAISIAIDFSDSFVFVQKEEIHNFPKVEYSEGIFNS